MWMKTMCGSDSLRQLRIFVSDLAVYAAREMKIVPVSSLLP